MRTTTLMLAAATLLAGTQGAAIPRAKTTSADESSPAPTESSAVNADFSIENPTVVGTITRTIHHGATTGTTESVSEETGTSTEAASTTTATATSEDANTATEETPAPTPTTHITTFTHYTTATFGITTLFNGPATASPAATATAASGETSTAVPVLEIITAPPTWAECQDSQAPHSEACLKKWWYAAGCMNTDLPAGTQDKWSKNEDVAAVEKEMADWYSKATSGDDNEARDACRPLPQPLMQGFQCVEKVVTDTCTECFPTTTMFGGAVVPQTNFTCLGSCLHDNVDALKETCPNLEQATKCHKELEAKCGDCTSNKKADMLGDHWVNTDNTCFEDCYWANKDDIRAACPLPEPAKKAMECHDALAESCSDCTDADHYVDTACLDKCYKDKSEKNSTLADICPEDMAMGIATLTDVVPTDGEIARYLSEMFGTGQLALVQDINQVLSALFPALSINDMGAGEANMGFQQPSMFPGMVEEGPIFGLLQQILGLGNGMGGGHGQGFGGNMGYDPMNMGFEMPGVVGGFGPAGSSSPGQAQDPFGAMFQQMFGGAAGQSPFGSTQEPVEGGNGNGQDPFGAMSVPVMGSVAGVPGQGAFGPSFGSSQGPAAGTSTASTTGSSDEQGQGAFGPMPGMSWPSSGSQDSQEGQDPMAAMFGDMGGTSGTIQRRQLFPPESGVQPQGGDVGPSDGSGDNTVWSIAPFPPMPGTSAGSTNGEPGPSPAQSGTSTTAAAGAVPMMPPMIQELLQQVFGGQMGMMPGQEGETTAANDGFQAEPVTIVAVPHAENPLLSFMDSFVSRIMAALVAKEESAQGISTMAAATPLTETTAAATETASTTPTTTTSGATESVTEAAQTEIQTVTTTAVETSVETVTSTVVETSVETVTETTMISTADATETTTAA